MNKPDLLKEFSANNRRLGKPLAAERLKKIIFSLEDENARH